jgi:hypothetical protein
MPINSVCTLLYLFIIIHCANMVDDLLVFNANILKIAMPLDEAK